MCSLCLVYQIRVHTKITKIARKLRFKIIYQLL